MKLKALNIIYHNHYHQDDPALAEWKSAYHLEAVPGSKRKNRPDGNGTPPPPDGTDG